jgi:hypothetical protein
MKDRPTQPLDVEVDIRRDSRWSHGYLDCWEHDQAVSHLPSVSPASDPCEVFQAWFREAENFVLLAGAPGQKMPAASTRPVSAILATDEAYNNPLACPMQPRAVLIGCPPADLNATAARYNSTPPTDRPLLMHAYLPAAPFVDFLSAALPRPVPILPLLIRTNQYEHRPAGPHPTTAEFLAMLAAALKKSVVA